MWFNEVLGKNISGGLIYFYLNEVHWFVKIWRVICHCYKMIICTWLSNFFFFFLYWILHHHTSKQMCIVSRTLWLWGGVTGHIQCWATSRKDSIPSAEGPVLILHASCSSSLFTIHYTHLQTMHQWAILTKIQAQRLLGNCISSIPARKIAFYFLW